ncbi:hypothetical protein BGW38_010160 [Lunasporangiospora selenospora]|uniref:Ricin B lectin domain-containing protein n=1 Tax=Lunasporangiospora selenospora TaxID=979761 RepID=A0A9P6FWG3_9FUNG|nr:hypothetical protein BGW38_010160 [Lunasporangiospora selenospora]
MKHFVTLLFAVLVTILQVCTALPDGFYRIKFNNLLLTDYKRKLNGYAVLYSSHGVSVPQQEWFITNTGNGEVVIRNMASQHFLSFEGDPSLGKFVTLSVIPRKWKLSVTDGSKLNIQTVDGGQKLNVAVSSLAAPRPRTELARPDKSVKQAWQFENAHDFEQPHQYRLSSMRSEVCQD